MEKEQPKYKVGDKVWYHFISHNTLATVREIRHYPDKSYLYFCDFYLSGATFREDELFETEEELNNDLQIKKREWKDSQRK